MNIPQTKQPINVYDYLCMCVDKNNECFPNKRTIATHCSISIASVTRALRELEKAKMISTVARFERVEHEKSYIRQTSNIYHVYETPQIGSSETFSPEPMDEPNAEPAKVSKQVEVCACAPLQDEKPDDISNVANSELDVSLSAQQSAQDVQEANDVTIATEQETDKTADRNTSFAYFLLSALTLAQNMFFCPTQPIFDTPPHVIMTPQGTRTKVKVTDNLRKESILTKLTKWYKLHKYTKLAG